MIRREYLALLGTSTASLSGCLGGFASDTPSSAGDSISSTEPTVTSDPTTATDDDRRVPMGQSVPVDGTEFRVANPRLSKALVSMGVHDPTLRTTTGQFVVVDVLRNGEPPDMLTDQAIRSSVDGETPSENEPVPSIETGRWGFPFPVAQSDTASIRWETEDATIYWDLPTEIRTALASEPKFRVKSFEVPRRDGQLVLDLLVANDGDSDGTFKAEVSMEEFSGKEIIEFSVPAGESRRYTGRANKILLYFENNGGGTLTVTYPSDSGLTQLERTVEV